MKSDISDKSLCTLGKKRILWALDRMPVLALIRERFAKTKPFLKLNIGACLHVTTETAVLAITLKSAGANLRICASNPLSTQDDVAASLVYDYGISTFARRGENKDIYYKHLRSVSQFNPRITLDDGADLVSTIHKQVLSNKYSSEDLPWAGTEETTTGVIRLRALEKAGKLLYPVIAVNDAYTKHLFDNRYGTGQSSLDGIIRATNKLIAGTVFVVCGYGWCGKGIAKRAGGMGANVVVCEVDHLKALEAIMDGFRVMPLKQASKIGDIFITVTGDINVLAKDNFLLMKDKVILANSGHFDVEINLKGLKEISEKVKEVKPLVSEYTLRRGSKPTRIYVLAQGRLVNLSCAEGHPAEVMDMSFANQALCCEYIAKNHSNLRNTVYKVPADIDRKVARLKLKSMGIKIDILTKEQKQYLSSWQIGT